MLTRSLVARQRHVPWFGTEHPTHKRTPASDWSQWTREAILYELLVGVQGKGGGVHTG